MNKVKELEDLIAAMVDELEVIDADEDPSPITEKLGALMMQAHNLDACNCDKIQSQAHEELNDGS